MAEQIPSPLEEYQFHPVRRWRFDYAWPFEKVALEVDGGIFINGRHNRGPAMLAQWEKENEAQLMGWTIIKCTPSDLLTVRVTTMIRRALNIQ